MGKKLFHASHFSHSVKKRSPKRFQQLKTIIDNDQFRIKSQKPLKDKTLFKYWKNRQHLFSKINQNNIYMTDELWFSVTPEIIAKFFAQFIKSCMPNAQCILDVFCGGGGNSIQFGNLFPKVIGIDNNLNHLYCTAMNAKAYGVAQKLWLRYGSWSRSFVKENEKWLNNENIDCIFASPPWGGPQYLSAQKYDLEKNLIPMGITSLLKTFKEISGNIMLFLPRNSDLNQLAIATREVFGNETKCKVLYVKQNNYMKGIICMWGEPFLYYQASDDGSSDGDGLNKAENINSSTKISNKTLTDLYDIHG